MKTRSLFFLTAFVIAGLLFFTGIKTASAAGTDVWRTIAADYEQVAEAAKKENRPFILFFYADWCSYCQRFREGLLKDANVEEFLSHHLRLMINPEKGSKENALSTKYGVRSYPTFLVVRPNGSRVKVHPFNQGGTLLHPDEFIANLKSAMEK